jgi:hypothetical protein
MFSLVQGLARESHSVNISSTERRGRKGERKSRGFGGDSRGDGSGGKGRERRMGKEVGEEGEGR